MMVRCRQYKCAGLTGEQLAERTVPPSALSLLGLVRHMTTGRVPSATYRRHAETRQGTAAVVRPV